MRDIRESQENRRRHVAPGQPLGHLLSVGVDELERRTLGRAPLRKRENDDVSRVVRAQMRAMQIRAVAGAKR